MLFRSIDANLQLEIIDSKGLLIKNSQETFAIENNVNMVRRMNIYQDAPLGIYEINLKIFLDGNETASSSQTFYVSEIKSKKNLNQSFITASIIATVIILILSISLIIYNNVGKK